ncbi:MAG: hypothetical protein AB1546_07600 [bacterium]
MASHIVDRLRGWNRSSGKRLRIKTRTPKSELRVPIPAAQPQPNDDQQS